MQRYLLVISQREKKEIMKQMILCLLVITVVLNACSKPESNGPQLKTQMQIVKVETPKAVVKGTEIVSNVTCEAPNLCYTFSHFDVKNNGNRNYEIRAIADYPNRPPGEVFCAQMIYRIDTTLRIPAPDKGTYMLRFYNKHNLFETDTVVVN
jgi:hypothetical protein